MRVTCVFDSSTLILLAKSTLLRTFANPNNAVITSKVNSEVFVKDEAEDVKIIKKLLDDSLIKKVQIKSAKTDFAADFGLGEGEAEALSLALQEKFILATDDWRAIKACKVFDIRFINAIHCLLALYNNKLLDQRLALEKLNTLEKYGRYSTQIIEDNAKNGSTYPN